MLYTLTTWALWLVLVALVAGVFGWLLGRIGRARAVAAAIASCPDPADVAELQAVVDKMPAVLDDRDQWKAEADQLREVAALVDAQTTMLNTVTAQRDALDVSLTELHAGVAELRVRTWNAEARAIDLMMQLASLHHDDTPPEPDLGEAADVIGAPVTFNDLTQVVGIGPKIADLCREHGITTWWSLANTGLESLRTMLADAGPKFQVHDPTSWPQQARLLANGQWEKFKTLADALHGGRTAV